MNCRAAERLCSYSRDHSLAAFQAEALERHLAECANCRRREQRFRELMTALSSHRANDPGADLVQRALSRIDDEKATALAQHRSQWSSLFRKEKRTMLRNFTVTVLAVLIAGTIWMETRPQRALGQAALQKMHSSMARAKTMHHVTWAFLLTEEEAKTNTWNDNKKPARFDTWLTRDAMRGGDEFNGPYLWTAAGYLHYDREVNQIKYMNPGPEMPLKDAIEDAFNPLAKFTQSAPPGTYLSVKRLEDTRWREHNVYKVQISSGPQKPAPGEEVPVVQEPGKTPPISQGPNIRETYWVDKLTDLPVYSESEKQIHERWVLLSRNEYDYNRPVPPSLLDTEVVRKELEAFGAARQKRQ